MVRGLPRSFLPYHKRWCLHASRVCCRDDFYTICIDHFEIALAFLGRNHFYGAGVVGVHSPLSDIEMMGTHVGKCTVAVFTVSSPCGKVIMHIIRAKNFIESTHGCWPKPCIPIYSLGSRFSGQIAGLGGTPTHTLIFLSSPIAPLRTISTVRRNFPPYSDRCWLPVWKTTPFSFTASAIARPFLDGKRYWFFTVHMLFGTCGTNCGFSMPVIGRGDKHGIEGFVLQAVPNSHWLFSVPSIYHLEVFLE